MNKKKNSLKIGKGMPALLGIILALALLVPYASAQNPSSPTGANPTPKPFNGPIIQGAVLPSGTLWGNEAAGANGRIIVFDLTTDTVGTTFVPDGQLVPPNLYGNGRGVAYDPTDGNIWYTSLNHEASFGGPFHGDGLIHKAPPGGGADILTIPVPGTVESEGIGAIDYDHTTTGVIYAAGYIPIGGLVVGNPDAFYKIDATTGAILNECTFPSADGSGDDTLAVAEISGLGKVLLTDAGEFDTTTLYALDPDTCALKASYTLPVAVTGIDWDPATGDLIGTDLSTIYNFGPAPFGSIIGSTPWVTSTTVEDISLALPKKGGGQIPEFPTVALPVVGVIGLLFLFSRRKHN